MPDPSATDGHPTDPSGATAQALDLSPARFGEATAHLSHFRDAPRERVLQRLGYDVAWFDRAAAAARERLGSALEGLEVDPVLAFANAFDVTQRRLRARRPELDRIVPDASLEPRLEPRVVRPQQGMAPLPPAPAPAARPASADVPSYLQAPAPMLRPEPAGVAAPVIQFAMGPLDAPKPANKLAATALVDPSRASAPTLPFAESRSIAAIVAALDAAPAPADEGELARYAELIVALASTDDRQAILTRFQLTEESRQALAADWGKRINASPALRARFDEHLKKARAKGDGR